MDWEMTYWKYPTMDGQQAGVIRKKVTAKTTTIRTPFRKLLRFHCFCAVSTTR